MDAFRRLFRMVSGREIKGIWKPRKGQMVLAGDGTLAYYGVCNFCGRTEILAPVASKHLCPRCLGKGVWDSSEVKLERSGYCDLCGIHYIGAGVYVEKALACFRCLWLKLGRQHKALRPEGSRLV